MNIDEIRTQYPQYDDLSDQQLADGFHSKFYSDIPKEDFYTKLGLPAVTVGDSEGLSKYTSFGYGMLEKAAGVGKSLGLIEPETYKQIHEESTRMGKGRELSRGIGQMAGTLTMAAPAMALPGAAPLVAAPILGGAIEGTSRHAELGALQPNIDPKTQMKASLARGVETAGEFALPLSLPGKLLTRIATGAGGNVAFSELDIAIQNKILEDYPEIKMEQFDPTTMTVSALFGGILAGAFGPKAKAKAEKETTAPKVEGEDLPSEFVSRTKQSASETLNKRYTTLTEQMDELNKVIESPRSEIEGKAAQVLKIELHKKMLELEASVNKLAEEGFGTPIMKPEVTPPVEGVTQPPIDAPVSPVDAPRIDDNVPQATEVAPAPVEPTVEAPHVPEQPTPLPLEELPPDSPIHTIVETMDEPAYYSPYDVLDSNLSPMEKVAAIEKEFGDTATHTLISEGRVEDLFETVPNTNIKVVKGMGEIGRFVEEAMDRVGLSKDTTYVIPGKSTGKYAPRGDKAIISINRESIEARVADLHTKYPEVSAILKGMPLKKQQELGVKLVIAHEVGHHLLVRALHTQLFSNAKLNKLIGEYLSWRKQQSPETLARESAGGSIWDMRRAELTQRMSTFGEDANHWDMFHEFFAQRVSKEIVFGKEFGTLRNLFQDIVNKFPFFKNTNFIDTEIKRIIYDNKQHVNKFKETLFEYMHKKNQPKNTVEDIAVQLNNAVGGLKSGEASYGPIQKPITVAAARAAPGKDISWFSSHTLVNIFGKQQFSSIHEDSPLIRAANIVIRQAEQKATQIANKLWLGNTPYTGNIKINRIIDKNSPAERLKRASDVDLYEVHQVLQQGMDAGIPRSQALQRFGQNLTQGQKDLYTLFGNVWDKQHQEAVGIQKSLNKKNILPYRPDWYPSVRLGDYFVELQISGATGYREHFRTRQEAEHFIRKFNSLNNKQGIVATTVQDIKQVGGFDESLTFADMVKKELDSKGIQGGSQAVEDLLSRLITRGGKLGKHHQYRVNMPGYMGAQLFRSKNELGRSFKEAIHTSIEEYAGSLRKMMISSELDDILAAPGGLEKTHPNTLEAISIMQDVATNRIQVMTRGFDDYVRGKFDNMYYHVAKALGDPSPYPKVSAFDRSHGTLTSFFYIKSLMTRPAFWFGQVMTSPTSIRHILREDNVFGAMASAGRGVMQMLHPDDEFRKAVFWVSQNTNTFHPQFVNDLNTLPGLSASNHEFTKKTIDVLTGSLPSTASDSFSRYWTFSAMYEHYKGKGLKGQELLDKAIEGTDATMVQYGRSNKAPMFQKMGIVGDMLSPLQTFGQAQFGNLVSDFIYFKKSMPADKFNAAMPMIATFLTTMLLGGAIGLPLVAEYEAIRLLIEKMTGYRMPSVVEWALAGDKRIVSHGLASAATGQDISSGLRWNPVMGGIATGQKTAMDFFPAVSFTADAATAVGTLVKGSVKTIPEADMREAAKKITPGGYFGIVDDVAFNATERKFKPTALGEAEVKQTGEERLASYLGTRTVDSAYKKALIRQQEMHQQIISDRRNTQYRILGDAIQQKNPLKAKIAVKKLIDSGLDADEILSRTESDILKRNIPEYERKKYGLGSISTSRARTIIQYEDLENE